MPLFLYLSDELKLELPYFSYIRVATEDKKTLFKGFLFDRVFLKELVYAIL